MNNWPPAKFYKDHNRPAASTLRFSKLPPITKYTPHSRLPAVIKPTFKKNNFKIIPEKPVFSTPLGLNYDIHSNSFPNSNLVIDYNNKGPIYTIPAPNLSLADKPENKHTLPEQEHVTKIETKKATHYQVTEPIDASLYESPTHLDFSDKFNQNHHRTEISSGKTTIQNVPGQLIVSSAYQLSHPQSQQQLLDAYTIPILEQPQLQEHLIQQQQTPIGKAIQKTEERKPFVGKFNQNNPDNLFSQTHFLSFNNKAEESKHSGTVVLSKTQDDASNNIKLAQTHFVQSYYQTQAPTNIKYNEKTTHTDENSFLKPANVKSKTSNSAIATFPNYVSGENQELENTNLDSYDNLEALSPTMLESYSFGKRL